MLAKTYSVTGLPALLIILAFLAVIVLVGGAIGRRTPLVSRFGLLFALLRSKEEQVGWRRCAVGKRIRPRHYGSG